MVTIQNFSPRFPEIVVSISEYKCYLLKGFLTILANILILLSLCSLLSYLKLFSILTLPYLIMFHIS
ncbi:hypothetical protein I79_008950 [Cricetulus griseus]|uniref:Uncharacterized protein n=1 Tax=Cricetulus griseus TaxID=10029 RepID=G3HEG6_CRIGR|nr:hypothetical protein I79_008950 [Cricetulus griseus]